jgi:hypothetical protein
LLALSGDLGRAAQLLASSEALTEGLGAKTPWWAAKRNDQRLDLIRYDMGEDELSSALAHGRGLTFKEAVALALGETD